MLTILCLVKQHSELTHVHVLTRCDLYPAFQRYLSTLYTQVAPRQSLSGLLFYWVSCKRFSDASAIPRLFRSGSLDLEVG